MTPEPGDRFLLVDDDERLRPRMARALRERGFDVSEADGPPAAMACLDEADPDYAVVDLRMPTGSGLDLVPALLEARPTLQILVLTGYGSIPTAVEAIKRGAVDYLAKPADVDMVLAALAGVHSAPEHEAPSLDRVEWEHIQRVLEDCDGNVSHAARKLGVHRRTLQRKLNRNPPLK